MIERVLENWLDNATEKTFQVPFCHILQKKGYTVLHLSRHCAMEMGKDIIALDPQGTPCAFQLKSPTGSKGKINLTQWREIKSQILDLVTTEIIHPSIENSTNHRSFLVTNGELEEEVMRAIDEQNRYFAEHISHDVKLETIVRGQILEDAKQIGNELWPADFLSLQKFLTMYLSDGKGIISKEQIASIFMSGLFLNDEITTPPSKTQLIRNMSSCAILCSSAIASYSENDNYTSIIIAWTILLAHIYACAERWSLESRYIQGIVSIIKDTIHNYLLLLCEEMMERNHYVENNAITDKMVYRLRITLLVGLMSCLALWNKRKGLREFIEHEKFIKEFCLKRQSQMLLWGEAAVPQFLSNFWYLKTISGNIQADVLIANLVQVIISYNNHKREGFVANPYFEEDNILPVLFGLPGNKLNEDFKGNSYTVEGLVHLLTRRLWKQGIKSFWPGITRVGWSSFYPKDKWQYYLWRSTYGKNVTQMPTFPKRWDELLAESRESKGAELPLHIKEDPVMFLLFLIVYPHRCRADAVRWLDTQFCGL